MGDGEFNRVQEAGLLLVALLRRTFEWPSVWYAMSAQVTWAGLVRNLVGQSACSSWTAAILEGCLLPKQRESFLLSTNEFKEFRGDDDTTLDPPHIASRQRLLVYIRKALRILEQNQITVQGHMPRQLVPVRIEQMSNEDWELPHESDGPEYDDDDE